MALANTSMRLREQLTSLPPHIGHRLEVPFGLI
jgi:hypothetical protein